VLLLLLLHFWFICYLYLALRLFRAFNPLHISHLFYFCWLLGWLLLSVFHVALAIHHSALASPLTKLLFFLFSCVFHHTSLFLYMLVSDVALSLRRMALVVLLRCNYCLSHFSSFGVPCLLSFFFSRLIHLASLPACLLGALLLSCFCTTFVSLSLSLIFVQAPSLQCIFNE
jgi:hypothetical protein